VYSRIAISQTENWLANFKNHNRTTHQLKKSSTNKLTILTIHQLKRHELINLQPKQHITLKLTY